MSVLAILFLAYDSISHILMTSAVVEGMKASGFDPNLNLPIGVILLVCILLYVIPRTAFIGALLLTAYLGGAVAVNVLTKTPFTFVLMAMVVAVFIWAGLYVKSAHLRALVLHKVNA